MNKKVLAITLARGGSKRIPRKNIYPILGRPLLMYTVDEVRRSKIIDKYVVSTDDEDIISLCKKEFIEYHKRPDYLASDTSTSADALIDVVNNNPGYDIIAEIMCTNPLKTVEDIDNCIKIVIDGKRDTAVSVVRIYDHHPSRVKYIENDRLVDFYPEVPESRRQDLVPSAYVRNGSVYVMTRESLLSTKTRLGVSPYPCIMPSERTINIDEPIDLVLAKETISEKRDRFNQENLTSLWINSNVNNKYQYLIKKRHKLHRCSAELAEIVRGYLRDRMHVFEIGCGCGRNLFYFNELNKNIKVAGNDLVKEQCFKYMHDSLKTKINFYEINSCELINQNIECDFLLASDHFMHLRPECVKEIMECIINKWKPKYIMIRDAITPRYEFPAIFVHDYSILDNEYDVIYRGLSKHSKYYQIVFYGRKEKNHKK